MYCRLIRARIALVLLVLLVVASSCAAAIAPRNVILLIGDGMGVGAVTAGRCAGPGRDGRLNVDKMPYTGFAITFSANKLVTDSAAAGTALATGTKTTNGTISMDPKGKRLRTILEYAKQLGKSGGVVSTKFITDATPAVFVAHADNRAKNEEIAVQMALSSADVIMGGGKQYFLPKSAGGTRSDQRNLLDEAKQRGFDVFDSAEAMNATKSNKIIGLFAPNIMLSERPEPTIAEMTAKAISVLNRNKKGFFLMAEGGKIDSCEHGNDAAGAVKEMLMFDDAIRAALDFAKKDGHTLVVVTADHETGGFAVREPDNDNPKFKPGWVYGGHTGNMVPIYAYGPGAEAFTGTHDNTEIPTIFARYWGGKLN